MRPGLENLGYRVETGKAMSAKVQVPVLCGRNGMCAKSFEADAYSGAFATVIEIEAGRGVANYQFLKDLFQACMMHDTYYLAMALRLQYRGSKDFERAAAFFDTLYASGRVELPLRGVLLIGC